MDENLKLSAEALELLTDRGDLTNPPPFWIPVSEIPEGKLLTDISESDRELAEHTAAVYLYHLGFGGYAQSSCHGLHFINNRPQLTDFLDSSFVSKENCVTVFPEGFDFFPFGITMIEGGMPKYIHVNGRIHRINPMGVQKIQYVMLHGDKYIALTVPINAAVYHSYSSWISRSDVPFWDDCQERSNRDLLDAEYLIQIAGQPRYLALRIPSDTALKTWDLQLNDKQVDYILKTVEELGYETPMGDQMEKWSSIESPFVELIIDKTNRTIKLGHILTTNLTTDDSSRELHVIGTTAPFKM